MRETSSAACILFSPFTPSQVRIKLKAQVEQFPTPAIFAKREIAFPQVVVRFENEEFQLSQRKSYLNPWEPVFLGGVIEADDQGALVIGEWKSSKVLQKGMVVYRAILSWSVAGLAYLGWLVYQSAGMNHFLIGAMGVVALQLVGSIVVIEACKKRYQRLSGTEKNFVLDFLLDSLQAHPVPPQPESPDPAASEKMERLAA